MSPIEAAHIIDDDPSIRSALTNLVDSVGLTARAYGSVSEFLDAQNQEGDAAGCLLLDVQLPGLNGLDFQARMAEHGLTLPVILMTGHGSIPMSVRGMKAGAVDFLTKPFAANEMLEAIGRALDIDRARRAEAAGDVQVLQRYETLSKREREVMALVTAGMMNKQVGGELGISQVTVKFHRGAVMRKMGVRSLADLVRLSEQLQKSGAVEPTGARV